ncbi:MAG: MFS transporter [Lachnospiraceae bacterium]
MQLTFRHTKYACYIAYIVQAIGNNLAPLLFVAFRRQFGFSLEFIGSLIVINFAAQMLIDFASTKYVDRLGFRKCVTIAHIASTIGFLGLGIFPYALASPKVGVILAMLFSAMGGGLLEVIVSPIIHSLPGDEKASAMSILHSFYCWGQMLVVIGSTLYFVTIGTANFRYLPMLWAIVPFVNLLAFINVPMAEMVPEEERIPLREVCKTELFWLLMIMMVCAGASELAMSQWSSYFAEMGLKVSKTMGDLLGMCGFAFLMGIARSWFAVISAKTERLHDDEATKRMITKNLIGNSILCIASYMIASFSPWPLLALIGCALCGFSVGIMWPGCFSLATATFPKTGTGMFAYLALGGDIGCAAGPMLVTVFSGMSNGEIRSGLTIGMIFPIMMIVAAMILKRRSEKTI